MAVNDPHPSGMSSLVAPATGAGYHSWYGEQHVENPSYAQDSWYGQDPWAGQLPYGQGPEYGLGQQDPQGAQDPYGQYACQQAGYDPSAYGQLPYGVGGYGPSSSSGQSFQDGGWAGAAFAPDGGLTALDDPLFGALPGESIPSGYPGYQQQAPGPEQWPGYAGAWYDPGPGGADYYAGPGYDQTCHGGYAAPTAEYPYPAPFAPAPAPEPEPAHPGSLSDLIDEDPPDDPGDTTEAPAAEEPEADEDDLDAGPDARPARSRSRSGGSRRRAVKRSAMLTVAVPSACVMGVAAVAAATVVGPDSGHSGNARADSGHAPSTKLDQQLTATRADANDFADRASRSQERIDIKQRQAAEKKKKDEAAARKEAARPKYVLPVTQHGLSALFGQSGVNWMSLHTGIDFPVALGTPVHAVTDGMVSTKWNSAYGNMAMVTAPDGTVTWYCHLSSTKIRSGTVKAGDVIAYSGSTGNSTGPHLHLEVHPHGGAAVDPLPWLLSHGLDPR